MTAQLPRSTQQIRDRLRNSLAEPSPVESNLSVLRRKLSELKRCGYRIRSEWLGGETGGTCEIAGVRWLFLDLSRSVDEQLEQVEDALHESRR
jgi:hypothetical protein